MCIFDVATPYRHQGFDFFLIFSWHWSFITYVVALSHCRCRAAKQLLRAQFCSCGRQGDSYSSHLELKHSCTGVRLHSQKAWYNFLIKSCFQFSLQKGAKPTLKKSESLFHTERIALSYRANCSFIQSELLFHTERTALSYRANRSFIQSKSLFHTERIAYVFKKVKIAISSFWSSRSFKKSNRSNLLLILFGKATKANRSRCS